MLSVLPSTSTIRIVSTGIPTLTPMVGRSPCLHVSTIINDLCLRLGHFDSRDDPTLNPATYMELGSTLEHALIQRLHLHSPNRYLQPGEFSKDGIAGTPDLLDISHTDHPCIVVDEIKLAWMSSAHSPDSNKFWRYWTQLAAYCWLVETLIGRLRITFVNGDYKGSGPHSIVYERTFTRQELAENWMMLRNHGRKLKVA